MTRITDFSTDPTKFSSRRIDVPEMDVINLVMFRENAVTGGLTNYALRISGFSTRNEIAQEWRRLRKECREFRSI